MKLAGKILGMILLIPMMSFNVKKSEPIRAELSEKPFIIVGQMPHFPGGKLAMNRYISDNMTYPFDALKNNVQGKVNIEFVVEKDGSIVQVRAVGKHLGFGLEEQAVKIFNSMPKWVPGRQDGIAVPVYMMIPIIYTL